MRWTRTAAPLAPLVVLFAAAVPSSAAGQACAWSAHVGVGVPLRQLPPRNAPDGDVRSGPGLALSRLCGGGSGASRGFTAVIQDYRRLAIAYLLGDFGRQWGLGAGERSPWVQLRGRAGLAGAFDLGDTNPRLDPGRRTKLPSIGLGFGVGLGLGVPAGPGDFVLDAFLLATFLETELVGAAGQRAGGGVTTFVSVPVSIGYRFAP